MIVSCAGLAACSSDDPGDAAVPTTVASPAVGDEPAAEDEPALEVQVGDDAETQADVAGTEDQPAVDSEPAAPEETSWVVVVAGASDPFDSLLTESVDEIAEFGFEGRISNCDRGAAEAIGMAADTTFTVSAPFDSQDAAAEAVAVLAANQIEVVATEVVVACPE